MIGGRSSDFLLNISEALSSPEKLTWIPRNDSIRQTLYIYDFPPHC
jgi:hypothetical protein